MTKIPLIAVFSVWLFVVYGQIPFNNFDPYHAYYIPHTSTFTNQPIRHVNDGTEAQSGETGEFKNNPSNRKLIYQGVIFFKIKQLEATTASLARQLKAMQTALDDRADKTALAEKADKTALDLKADKTAVDLKADKTAVDLKADKTAVDLKADKTALDLKADKTALDLKADKTAVDLKADKTALDLKADKTAMQTALDAKADKTALDLKADITALNLKADKTAVDLKADKTALDLKADITDLDLKADKTALDPINTALNKITTPSSIGKIPTSCGDLKTIGFVNSGIFSIMDSKRVKNVYCDFTKTTAAELQKMIGTVDVKSAPVHFYVQRNSPFYTNGTPIPFNLARVNEGNAMDLTSGKFKAPRPGIYFFSFTGVARLEPSSTVDFYSYFLLNGNLIGSSLVHKHDGVIDQNSVVTLQSTLNLKKGDQVWVQISSIGSSSMYLNDNSSEQNTHFTGFMLEEEIFDSL